MFVHLPRYARVFHRPTRTYGNAVAPGPSGATVLFAVSNAPVVPVNRDDLRPLRWYERLFNL